MGYQGTVVGGSWKGSRDLTDPKVAVTCGTDGTLRSDLVNF